MTDVVEIGEAPQVADDEDTVDFQWLASQLKGPDGEICENVEVMVDHPMGGLSGASLRFLIATFEGNKKTSYVYKSTTSATLQRAKSAGLPREAFFYAEFSELIKECVSLPFTPYIYGNMTTGAKTIVMEDLSVGCVQSGYFFGAGSPLNWGKDPDQLVAASKPSDCNLLVTAETVSRSAFHQAAKLHAIYWMDDNLLQSQYGRYLRSWSWIQGKGEETFMASQNLARGMWKRTKDKISTGSSTVLWSPDAIALMDASLGKIDWKNHVENMIHRQWTFVHGDFHPGNIMWRWTSGNAGGESVLVDWEMVGLGSGPQDLAQYMISHSTPEFRSGVENKLLKEYYDELIASVKARQRNPVDLSETYTFENCKADYIAGGIERWVWLLAVLSGICPDPMVQYFHNQFHAFAKSHGVNTDTIGMPRV